MKHGLAPIFLSFMLLFSCAGCEIAMNFLSHKHGYFITGNKDQRERLSILFEKLEKKADSPEEKYIIIYQIIKQLHLQDELDRLNLFLTTFVEKHPDDPFNAYYLLIVADNNRSRGAYPLALQYYERILRNYSDLLVQGNSVHFHCLDNLINLVQDPSIKISHYKDLLARFSDRIDHGPVYYNLARAYEKVGDWDLSIQAYKRFLTFPDATIRGEPDAREEITRMVAFYDRKDKNWIWDNLDELVDFIKTAIWSRNSVQMVNSRARVNFFAQVWAASERLAKQDISPDEFIADIHVFLRTRVYFSQELDPASNNREAYLKTWGWSHRINTWYLYFRRIDFPADPEIHGKWEWGGIYFGDKPFS